MQRSAAADCSRTWLSPSPVCFKESWAPHGCPGPSSARGAANGKRNSQITPPRAIPLCSPHRAAPAHKGALTQSSLLPAHSKQLQKAAPELPVMDAQQNHPRTSQIFGRSRMEPLPPLSVLSALTQERLLEVLPGTTCSWLLGESNAGCTRESSALTKSPLFLGKCKEGRITHPARGCSLLSSQNSLLHSVWHIPAPSRNNFLGKKCKSFFKK